jgi:SAM-dependent methyltransferase
MSELRKPVDVATDHTVTSLRAHLPPEATLLEVGCGAGDVARALLYEGCDVLAFDSDGTAIAEARSRGVPARQADWPHFDGGPFDAIAFTPSLHHIHPLDAAVRRAHELLRSGALVLVEDAVRFVEARFRAERAAGEREEIMLIGRRLVGVR